MTPPRHDPLQAYKQDDSAKFSHQIRSTPTCRAYFRHRRDLRPEA